MAQEKLLMAQVKDTGEVCNGTGEVANGTGEVAWDLI